MNEETRKLYLQYLSNAGNEEVLHEHIQNNCDESLRGESNWMTKESWKELEKRLIECGFLKQ